jgi:hypothetical protein
MRRVFMGFSLSHTLTARPELVEGPCFWARNIEEQEGPPFDKLRVSGLGV